jgi:hypothetical protein
MYITPAVFAIITLGSCSSDDDGPNPDIAMILGNYAVTDTNDYGAVENYSIVISESKGELEISNFGDFMFTPVKATIAGSIFNIPPQTFKAGSMTIIITGNGGLSSDRLTFEYTIDRGDGDLYEHSCLASKDL